MTQHPPRTPGAVPVGGRSRQGAARQETGSQAHVAGVSDDSPRTSTVQAGPFSQAASNGVAAASPGSAGGGRRSRAKLVAAVAALLVVPPLAAGLLSTAQSPIYAAEADVLYQGGDSTDAQSIERELATQQVLLQSRPLIQQAAEVADRSPENVADAVSVEVLEQSSVLRVHVEDADPDVAEQIATSLVEEYIAAVQAQTTSSATAAEERQLLQEQVDGLNVRLDEVTTRIGELVEIPVPSAAAQLELRSLESEAETIRGRLTALQAQILETDLRGLQEGRGGAQVFAAATVLDEPVAPQPLRAAAAGALLGIALALALLALLRYRHERSRSART